MALHIVHVQPSRAARCAGEQGATAVEYALLVALVAAVIILAIATVGGQVATIFADYLASF